MNEQVQQQLAGAIGEITELIKGAKEFTMSQAPALAHEIVAWGIWSNAVEVAAWCIAMVVVGHLCAKLRASNDDDAKAMGVVLHGVVTILGITFIGFAANNLIKALVAPRLYIINYLGELMK